jgi:hypothetical protein
LRAEHGVALDGCVMVHARAVAERHARADVGVGAEHDIRTELRARFGFDGKPPRTFRELGSQMGVCKERIRQIQTRAMEKLRAMASEARLEQTVGDWL